MNTTAIAILKATINGPANLDELQEKLAIKDWALNNNIRTLKDRGYVTKEGQFLKIQPTLKTEQLSKVSRKSDIEKILRESNETVLCYLTEPTTIANLISRSNLSKATVYRAIEDLETVEGFVRQGDLISVAPDSPLFIFIKFLRHDLGIEETHQEKIQQLLKKEDASHKLTFDELKNHLWGAADVLRGTLDANEYRQPIMTLLYLKRINDRFDEIREDLLKQNPNEKWLNDKDQYDVFIPSTTRWNVLVNTFENIGEKLDEICAEIEHQDPILEGILTNTHYNDKKRYPDDVLLQLIAHFNKKRLRNQDLTSEDIFGQAYEYLLEQFADSAGKKAGEFFTPREVVQLLVELLQPREGMRICDPACGSGGMLIWAHKHIKNNPDDLELHGQERNFGNYGMCKMNMLLHGIKKFKIMHENVLKTPLLIENGNLIEYDLVLANFPFSMDWDSSNAANDPYGRFKFGIPPSKGKADFAFIQHIYSILNKSGKAAIICPQGVLFRGGEELKIRQRMVEDNVDVIEAVVGLPSNLFYGTGIPACVLILNKNKPKSRKNKILFIHAANDFEDLKKRAKLRPQDIEKIVTVFRNYVDVFGYCRIVSSTELKNNNYNLSVLRYVDISQFIETINIQHTIDELKKLKNEQNDIELALKSDLNRLGYEM